MKLSQVKPYPELQIPSHGIAELLYLTKAMFKYLTWHHVGAV